MNSKAYMIFDLQFGSTGKGALAGYLAKERGPDVVITAWGPNAGHTYIDQTGRKFIHRMLANGVVSPNLNTILIGPGSVIDLDCLMVEILSCKDLLKGKDIVIHPNAVIVDYKHKKQEAEGANVKIGSTMKGTGAAIIDRIKRDPDGDSVIARDRITENWANAVSHLGIDIYVDAGRYAFEINNADLIQIEGAQGFSLSMYHGFYPYTTSRDVTPAQVMADCAIPFGIIPEVYGTIRTFPIRVANRYNEKGVMIGNSGPHYHDQKELDWAEVGVEPELTTVTQLPRRVFSFSEQQLRESIHYCNPTKIFLNFANYLEDFGAIIELVERVNLYGDDMLVEWIGMGPGHDDIITIEDWEENT